VRLTLVEPFVVEIASDVAWTGKSYRHPIILLAPDPNSIPPASNFHCISKTGNPAIRGGRVVPTGGQMEPSVQLKAGRHRGIVLSRTTSEGRSSTCSGLLSGLLSRSCSRRTVCFEAVSSGCAMLVSPGVTKRPPRLSS